MDFIDTHQHLIYHDRFSYSWAADVPQLTGRDFNQDDYDTLTEGRGIANTIFMEVAVDDRHFKDEARFVAGLVGTHGMLGQIASCRPEWEDGTDEWLEECRDLHVVGFRRILHEMPDDLSQTETFRRNLRKIGAAGYTFDLCVFPHQHGITEDLVRACDQQAYVLDHCGVPDIAGDNFAVWAAGIDRLAALPQIDVKLSGITAYCAPGQFSMDVLRPWVDHILERFGPKRMLWGGDWPVVNLGAGLPGWIDLTHQLIGELSEDEQALIANKNARRVYGV